MKYHALFVIFEKAAKLAYIAKNMDPDQTALLGAILSGSIVFESIKKF